MAEETPKPEAPDTKPPAAYRPDETIDMIYCGQVRKSLIVDALRFLVEKHYQFVRPTDYIRFRGNVREIYEAYDMDVPRRDQLVAPQPVGKKEPASNPRPEVDNSNKPVKPPTKETGEAAKAPEAAASSTSGEKPTKVS